MNLLKKIYNYIFNVDYAIKDSTKLIKLRMKIISSNKNYFSKVICKIKKRKYNKLCYKNNCFIPLGIKFIEEGNVIFPHGLSGIFISSSATIGKNCTIFQQVTIGSNTLKDSKNNGAPIIGDNVYIGAGAKIIGGVTIGNNVRIGAGAIVVENIPDNSTVVMNNIKIIKHTEPRKNNFVPLDEFINQGETKKKLN